MDIVVVKDSVIDAFGGGALIEMRFPVIRAARNTGKEAEIPFGLSIEGSTIICHEAKQIADVVGRYDVEINGKTYDTVCCMDIEEYNTGVLGEGYIDKNGRTVLWRRFNKNDWNIKRYNEHFNCHDKLWSEMLPDNEQMTVNGEIYVHWYDCITDYIL